MRSKIYIPVTLALAFSVTAVLSGVAATPHAKAKSTSAKKTAGSSLVAQGKQLSTSQRCNTCHGADLAGKPRFSPPLHASWITPKYNQKTWERVMDTGVTEDGGKVHPPMPVYHMKAAQSDALFAYFKTLK